MPYHYGKKKKKKGMKNAKIRKKKQRKIKGSRR